MLLTSYIQQFILHHFYVINRFWSLALVSCQCCNVRYPLGFKYAIAFGRKYLFISNLVYAQMDPVPIDFVNDRYRIPLRINQFEVNRDFLPKAIAFLNPNGYRTLQHWQETEARLRSLLYHIEMV